VETITRLKPGAAHGQKTIKIRKRSDDVLEVRTTDVDPYLAEARAADEVRLAEVLAHFRRHGHQRPVRLVFCDDVRQASGPRVRLTLPANAVPLYLRDASLQGFVLTVDDAREMLRPLFGADAAQLFRKATWPMSFWEVHICVGLARVYETRTWQDVREAG
jgi:hypothetical protein